MTTKKTRNWIFILYPESAPNDWREKLQSLLVPCAISPLHTPDGEHLKEHHHILLKFEGNKSYEQVLEITQSLSATCPQVCNSLTGTIRYFAHLDNPEKQQFPGGLLDIDTLCGLDISSMCKYTDKEISSILTYIIYDIRNNDILEFCDLIDFYLDNDKIDIYQICQKQSLFLNAYITSRRNKHYGPTKYKQ